MGLRPTSKLILIGLVLIGAKHTPIPGFARALASFSRRPS